MATIKRIKDSLFLEVVRYSQAGDPVIYDVLNRPLVDLEQRTTDLDHHMAPYRGFRVRETLPVPTSSVEVEPGYYPTRSLAPPVEWGVSAYAGITLGPVAAAGAGTYRVDLIVFNRDTGASSIIAGTEQATLPLAYAGRGVPTLQDQVPLAYLYVDDALADGLSEYNTVSAAGYIQDIRLGCGSERIPLGTDASTMVRDGSANLGTENETVRSDHQHPLNVDDAVPPAAMTADSVGLAGVSLRYSRSGHRHPCPPASSSADIKKDTGTGLAGISSAFAKGTHAHPHNTSAANPITLDPAILASAGSSDYYARVGHRHAVSNCRLTTLVYTFDWPAPSSLSAQSTGALPGTPIACFITGFLARSNALVPDGFATRGHHIIGVVARDEVLGVVGNCIAGMGATLEGDHADWTSMYSDIAAIGSGMAACIVGGYGTFAAVWSNVWVSVLNCTQFSNAGIVFSPDPLGVTSYYGKLSLSVLLQLSV
jgi:hypothetical protein